MTIPRYAHPRNLRTPHPFHRIAAPRDLIVVLDGALTGGDVDGTGVYQGYATIGGGATGHPDVEAVLRDQVRGPLIDLYQIADNLDTVGNIVAGDLNPYNDCIDLDYRVPAGVGVRGINYGTEMIEHAQDLARRLALPDDETYAGMVVARAGGDFDADLIVTGRDWLLNLRHDPSERGLDQVVSPAEAIALIGLYRRWHHRPTIIAGQSVNWPPVAMHRSIAFVAMPGFERWNQAARAAYDDRADDSLHARTMSLLTRVSRAFRYRDAVFAEWTTLDDYDRDELLCELELLLVSLVGAFDVAAEIVAQLLNLQIKGHIGWQNDHFIKQLETVAPPLSTLTKKGSLLHQRMDLVRRLRNSIHTQALSIRVDDKRAVLTLPEPVQHHLRATALSSDNPWTAHELGIHRILPGGATAHKWLDGVGRYTVTVRRSGAPRPTDPLDGELTLDPGQFLNWMFQDCISDLDQIMNLTPLAEVPGYRPQWENPPRGGLAWTFSDTTATRLRLLYGDV